MFVFALTSFLFLLQSIDANRPKLDEFKPIRLSKIGTKLTILCVIQEGHKPFKFEWRFNDQLLSKTTSFDYRIDQIDDDQSRFMIPQLKTNHSGTYSCTARNNFGFDKQFTRLTVKGLFLSYPLEFPLLINMWRIFCC